MTETIEIPLGRVVMTPGARHLLEDIEKYPAAFLRRHQAKDWGDTCKEDARLNDEGVETGGRLMSVYNTPSGALWIITEWDRSVTTLLRPDEY
jgi:hypothetical protein